MTFDLVNKNHIFFLTYAQICLTLFGFTFVSIFFEKRNNFDKKVLRKLFNLNIGFLSAAIGFFILDSIQYVVEVVNEPSIILNVIIVLFGLISGFVSFVGFIYGVLILLDVLFDYA